MYVRSHDGVTVTIPEGYISVNDIDEKLSANMLLNISKLINNINGNWHKVSPNCFKIEDCGIEMDVKTLANIFELAIKYKWERLLTESQLLIDLFIK